MKMRVARKRRQTHPRRQRLQFGVLAGRVTVPTDFDAPLPPDVQDLFGGKVLRRMADMAKAVEVDIDKL